MTLDDDGSLDEDWRSLIMEWLLLSIPTITIMPVVNWLAGIWAFQWRQAITADYIYRWRLLAKVPWSSRASPTRAGRRVPAGEGVDSFGQGVFSALLSLGTFVPLLWRLTSGMETWADGTIVWVNVGSNVLGIGIGSLVGRHLITLEYNNQAVEAAFGKSSFTRRTAPPVTARSRRAADSSSSCEATTSRSFSTSSTLAVVSDLRPRDDTRANADAWPCRLRAAHPRLVHADNNAYTTVQGALDAHTPLG